MHRHNRLMSEFSFRGMAGAILVMLALPALLCAQTTSPSLADQPPQTQKKTGEYTLKKDVDLVVLPVSVLDKKGRRVENLKKEDFQVFEDGAPQKVEVFSHADIPVTMGIVIDDSGSMRPKRAAVNAAALAFVKTSNPQDQVFVVNFNDVSYLDTPGDFATNIEDLNAALNKIDSRGGTALRDAVYTSIDHMKLGNRDKKVLLVITDGEDNASRYTFEELLAHAQKSDTVIFSIGLLGDDESGHLFKIHSGESRRAAKALEGLSKSTGGEAYFPKTLEEVEATCVEIAHSIRNQYTLGYYPTNTKRDGSFRTVRVDASPSQHRSEKLVVRTRAGYYAPKSTQTASTSSGQ